MKTRRPYAISAGIVWFDPERRRAEIRAAVRRAAQKLPLVGAVLFGSLARSGATARSDADLLLVVKESPYERPRDRQPEALEALRPLPCPVDLFVVTEKELERARGEGSALVREIEKNGIQLWPQ